jgi:hypothetical protein
MTTKAGARAAVTGVLSGAGGPIAGASVCVWVREIADGAAKTFDGSALTDAKGRFRYALPTGPSQTIWVTSADNSKVTARLHLYVHANVELRPAHSTLRDGQTLALGGHLSKPMPRSGAIVVLQVWRGYWYSFEVVHSNAQGAFEGSWRFVNTSGSVDYKMRAVLEAQPSYPYMTSSSHVVVIHVAG